MAQIWRHACCAAHTAQFLRAFLSRRLKLHIGRVVVVVALGGVVNVDLKASEWCTALFQDNSLSKTVSLRH
jgi:hypothetical protein